MVSIGRNNQLIVKRSETGRKILTRDRVASTLVCEKFIKNEEDCGEYTYVENNWRKL